MKIQGTSILFNISLGGSLREDQGSNASMNDITADLTEVKEEQEYFYVTVDPDTKRDHVEHQPLLRYSESKCKAGVDIQQRSWSISP